MFFPLSDPTVLYLWLPCLYWFGCVCKAAQDEFDRFEHRAFPVEKKKLFPIAEVSAQHAEFRPDIVKESLSMIFTKERVGVIRSEPPKRFLTCPEKMQYTSYWLLVLYLEKAEALR